MKRAVSLILALILVTGLLASCGVKEEMPQSVEAVTTEEETTAEETTTEETTTETTTETETTTPEETTHAGNENLLTGTYDLPDEAVGLRPVAVAVNNVYEAQPQYGVSEADVIIEMPVEGNATRLLAIYADMVNLPYIVSIRSYRYYFAPMVLGFDAFYIHWGEDTSMLDYYYSLDMDTYDGIYGCSFFGRDQERLNQQYNVEHTSSFDGSQFMAVAEADGCRLELSDEYNNEAFLFNKGDETIAPDSDITCLYANVDWGANSSSFTYNEAEKKYYKSICGEPHVDGISGIQLNYTNLFILETDVWIRDDGYHRGVDWNGGEDSVGYYISAGKVQKIHWSKADEQSRLRFYDEDGNELSVNRGKSYITFSNPEDIYIETADESESEAASSEVQAESEVLDD